jgi:sporulation protein YlmC with PRC-barrel domain
MNHCTVRNPKGDTIGEIEDLVIDKDEGVVAYGVLTFGGFLGFGGKLFAVPFNGITRSRDDDIVVLDVPKEKLEAVPGFDKATWPDLADRRWGLDIHK